MKVSSLLKTFTLQLKKKKEVSKWKTNKQTKKPPNPSVCACLGFIWGIFKKKIMIFYPSFHFEYFSIGFLCSALLISELLRPCYFFHFKWGWLEVLSYFSQINTSIVIVFLRSCTSLSWRVLNQLSVYFSVLRNPLLFQRNLSKISSLLLLFYYCIPVCHMVK